MSYKGNGWSSDVSEYVYVNLNLPVVLKTYEKIEIIDEETIEIEDAYCSFFGCGRKLNLTEKLCGERCVHHLKCQKDIMNNVSV